ncbi:MULTISPECIES: MCE family protein [unclassified Actinopolyspora]|uniref:MCE family protein n=1 Tax=unclassified Actinopolyspora TaxID=2639451 RepID=UPI0013F67A7F|nr:MULTISPECIES: MCE family protein [unclassified Actinopolyspora]NHD16581.1 MCE family protein [Actinopolyspora sp. BKK2]NHE75556.1 MCE family protein [Actinopolyspora sp. BKK1]
MSRRLGKPPFTRGLALGSVLVLLVSVGVWWVFLGADQRRVVAYFDDAVGLYEGGEVRVLGVKVGSVDAVTPQPERVRVEMSVRRELKIPANAGAAVISPSVVSGRFVQLTPVYEGGPTLESGAVIPKGRTVTPVEIDEVYNSLNELSEALGPKGANSDGELSELLDTGARNLEGNGELISRTLRDLGEAGSTLSGSSEDLFATVDKLQKVTSNLAENDGEVRRFNSRMREINDLLASQRDDLDTALSELALALRKVKNFVRTNEDKLHSNVEQLDSIAKVVARQNEALRETLTNAPLALGNLQNSYNAASGTLDTRANLNELRQPPLVLLCKLLEQARPGSGNGPSQRTDAPAGLRSGCESVRNFLDAGGQLPDPAETISKLQRGQRPDLPVPLKTSSDRVFGGSDGSGSGGQG